MYETGNLFSFEDVFLNLGCGSDIRSGFVNIDIEAVSSDVQVGDARKLEYKDESVDMIVAVNLLESFRQQEIFPALKEWNRVLKYEAELLIQVPLFRLIYDAYQSGELQQTKFTELIFGESREEEQINKSIFDERYLRKLIEKAGFQIIESHDVVEPEKDKFDIQLKAVKTGLPAQKREYELNQLDFNFAYTYAELEKTMRIAEARQDSPLINVVWESSFYSEDNISAVNREICEQLMRSGKAELTIIPSDPDERDCFKQIRFKKLLENDIRFKSVPDIRIKNLPYVWIRHQRTPNGIEPKGARWIIMQDRFYSSLSKNFIEIYQQADEIWTSSEYSRSAFLSSGIKEDKLHVIPSGVNTSVFTPVGKKHSFSGAEKFTFVYAGELNYMSGADVLVDAFISAFSHEENVRLILCKSRNKNEDKSSEIQQKIKAFNDKTASGEIILIENIINQEHLAEIYRAANVFVSPCRSTGFPLHQLEAMASGLPMIVSSGGELGEYTHKDFTDYISTLKTSIGSDINKHTPEGETLLPMPDKDELEAIMKTLYTNPGSLFIKGIKAALYARKHHRWENTARQILSRIESIFNFSLNDNSSWDEAAEEIDLYLFEKIIQDYDKGTISDSLTQLDDIISSMPADSDLSLFASNLKCLALISDNKISEADELLKVLSNSDDNEADYLYLSALQYEAKNDYDSSVMKFKELCKNWDRLKYSSLLGFAEDEIMVKTANVLLVSNQDAEAMHYFTDAIKKNPANYKAYYGAARCFEAIGAKREALSMLDSAINLNEDYQEAIALKMKLQV